MQSLREELELEKEAVTSSVRSPARDPLHPQTHYSLSFASRGRLHFEMNLIESLVDEVLSRLDTGKKGLLLKLL